MAALASQVSVRSEFINRKKQTKNGMALHGMVKNKTKLKKTQQESRTQDEGKKQNELPRTRVGETRTI